MKRFLVGLCAVVLLSWVCSSNPVWADSTDPRTFVLSNERGSAYGGGLIDMLIAAGHGSKSLYQILQLLYDQPGTGIPADFVASVGNNPGGSEVFTVALSNFAGLNGPVGINANGTLMITGIYGRDYDGDTGFKTNRVHYPGIALANFTLAEDDSDFIDTGHAIITVGGNYLAIGIAYANASRSFVISNEAPGYLIDKLIAAGHGSDNLYQVLQFLAAQAGSGIPSDFVTEVGDNLPGSEVFTFALSIFADFENNPICINADGSLHVASIYGRNYDGQTGFVTNIVQYSGTGQARFTMATSPISYIDVGTGSSGNSSYQAIGIAWAGAEAPASIPTLNEWGMILMGLILAGIAAVSMRRRRAVGQRL
jgi:hypothetical protein